MFTNKFPIHLEKQNESIYVKYFKEVSKLVLRALQKVLNKSLINDHFSIYEIRKYKDANYDKSLIFDILRNLIKEQEKNEKFSYEKLKSELRKNFQNVDSWNQKLIIPILEKKYERLSSPELLAIALKDVFSKKTTIDLIENRVKLNVELIRTINREYFDSIHDVITEAVKKGYDLRTTEKMLKETTKVKESKARFWARDQVSKAMSEISRTRQLEAGFDGFIWRTMQDRRVRDRHNQLNRQVFSWEDGAVGKLTKSNMRFPGDDFRCRCIAEPVDLDDISTETQNEVGAIGSYKNFSGIIQKPSDLRSKEEFEKLNERDIKTKGYEKESIYYWLEGLTPHQIKNIVSDAQSKSKWNSKKLNEHINKDYRHEFIKGNNTLSLADNNLLVDLNNSDLLDYKKVTQFVRNNFTSIHFKPMWSKNKQIIFYEKNLDAIVIVDITNIENYKIVSLHKNTEKEKNFMNTIKVDSAEKMYGAGLHCNGIPLKRAVREGLTFLKDLRNDCIDDDIIYLLDALMEANGEYPEYDIEFLETFDIEVLSYYTMGFSVDQNMGYGEEGVLEKYSWHFFVYDIKKGDYPLERLPSHVRDILKERHYGEK